MPFSSTKKGGLQSFLVCRCVADDWAVVFLGDAGRGIADGRSFYSTDTAVVPRPGWTRSSRAGGAIASIDGLAACLESTVVFASAGCDARTMPTTSTIVVNMRVAAPRITGQCLRPQDSPLAKRMEVDVRIAPS